MKSTLAAASIRFLARGVTALTVLVATSATALDPQSSQLLISRTMYCAPGGRHAEGTFKLDAVAAMAHGSLAGKGTYHSRVFADPTEMIADEVVSFNGTFVSQDDRSRQVKVTFRVPGKFHYKVAKTGPRKAGESCDHYVCVGQTMEIDYSADEHLVLFDAILEEGKFEDTKSVSPGGHPCIVTTKLEIIGGKTEGEILVAAEHPIIPGHRDVINAITVTLPEAEKLVGSAAKTLRISLGAPGYGGLAETRLGAEAGALTRDIEIQNAEPGSTHRIFYAWRGEIIPDFTEKVTALLIGTEVTGSTTFDVGFGVEVAEFGTFVEKPVKTREVRPFRITAARSGGKSPSLGELAAKFDLELELKLERMNFQPATGVEQLISELSFNVEDWVEAIAHQGASLDAAATGSSPGSLYGSGLLWRVGSDGLLVDPGEPIDQRYPNYLPFQRGVHMFKAQVGSIVRGTEKLANPAPKAHSYTLNVEMKANAQEFFDKLVLGCASEIVQAVVDEIKELKQLNPAALAGVEVDALGLLWSCIKVGLETQAADEFLAQHILLNTLIMTVLETEADIEAIKEKLEKAAKPVLSAVPGRRIVIVEGGDAKDAVQSTLHGRLKSADDPRKLLAAPPAGQREAQRNASLSPARVTSKGARTALYALDNETVSVPVRPGSAEARMIVVGPEGAQTIAPAKDPKSGRWLLRSERRASAH